MGEENGEEGVLEAMNLIESWQLFSSEREKKASSGSAGELREACRGGGSGDDQLDEPGCPFYSTVEAVRPVSYLADAATAIHGDPGRWQGRRGCCKDGKGR